MTTQNMIERAYSTTPTATTIASWDANKNLSANNALEGYATTATAAATTTLAVGDAFQQYFTGSTTQTVVLPVTSTLVLGQSYYIVNNSSGIVTVQSSGGNTIQAMAANTTLLVTCILTSGTGTSSWNARYLGATSGGTVNSGTANQLAYYAGTGSTVSGLTTITNAQNGVTMVQKTGSAGGSYTTSSASLVDVDATNLSYTVTVPNGYKLHMVASGSVGGTAGGTNQVQVALTDTSGGGTVLQVNALNPGVTGGVVPFSLNYIFTGDGASHTFRLQFNANNGQTGFIINGAATGWLPIMSFMLMPSN